MARQNAAPAQPELDDDEPPQDIDAFRAKLALRLRIIISNQQRRWCGCREPACKRARACRAPRGDCSNRKPVKPLNATQLARAKAMLSRALREHGERLDAEQAQRGEK